MRVQGQHWQTSSLPSILPGVTRWPGVPAVWERAVVSGQGLFSCGLQFRVSHPERTFWGRMERPRISCGCPITLERNLRSKNYT